MTVAVTEETTGDDEATIGTSIIADEVLITTIGLLENALAAIATFQEAEAIVRPKTGGVGRVAHQLDRPADALVQEVAALRAVGRARRSLHVVDTLQTGRLNLRSDPTHSQEAAAVVITIAG